MPGLLKMIFQPNDGSRRTVRREVVNSRVNVEKAATRLEDTVRDLLERNDKLTGRGNANALSANQASK